MKAIAKTRPELGVEIIDAPMPHPGPDQILVRVAACGICGSDLHIYLWELGADRALSRMPAVIGQGVRILPSRVRVADTWRHAISLVSSGAVKVKPMVTHRYNIEGGIEAFELLRAKQGLKALIMPQGL